MKKILIFAVLLLSLAAVNAEIVIYPNNISVSTTINQQKNFTLNIANTYNFTIYNIEFSNLTDFTLGNISSIQPNSSVQVNAIFKSSTSYTSKIDSIVRFDYVVDIPISITTYQVNISSDGFNPDQITIRQGDSVQWNNKDDISHTATCSLFDLSLPIGSSNQYTFNTIGDFSYQDTNMFWGGDISVINRTSKNYVHNTNFDRIFPVSIDSSSSPTSINVSIPSLNYTIGAINSIQAPLTISNTGSNAAERVTLSDTLGWFAYDENQFNVNSGNSELVKLTIQPYITSTNQTNQTYVDILKIKASNSDEITLTFSITIPYDNQFDNQDSSDIGTINWLAKVFCPTHPTSFLCNQSIGTTTNGTIIYRDSQFTVNDSAKEWNAIKKKVAQSADTLSRTANDQNSFQTNQQTFNSAMNESMSKLLNDASSNKSLLNSMWNGAWISIFFIIIIACISYVTVTIRKRSNNRRVFENRIVKN